MDKTEKRILELISSAKKEDLLNNEDLVQTLQNSKAETETIQKRISKLKLDQ